MSGRKKIDIWVVVSVVLLLTLLLFTVFPVGNLLVLAFKTPDGKFTLDYFKQFFSKTYYYGTIKNSFKVACTTSILTTTIGVLFSYCYSFFKLKGRKFLFITCLLCGLSAPFIGAYAWIFLFGKAGVITVFLKQFGIKIPDIYGYGGIVLVQVSRMFPLVVLYMNGAFRNIDESLLEASSNLGISGAQRFFRVTLVLVMPTLLAAFLVSFLRSLSDFGTPLVIGRGFDTFPLRIYEQFTSENAGGSVGMSAAISVISVLMTLLIFLLQKYANSKFKFTINAHRHITQKDCKGFSGVLMHIFTYGIIILSLAPQFYIIYLSFCNFKNSTRQAGYGFGNYTYAWTRRYLSTAIKNTLLLGVGALVIVVIIAIFVAYVVIRRPNAISHAVDSIAMSPYVIPGLVIGVAMAMTLNKPPINIAGTLLIMIAALTVRNLPNTLRSTTAALQQIPLYTEEASLNLGASKMKTFFRITVPMMKNGVLSGAVLSWTSIITEVASSLILYNNKTLTLTVGTYKMMKTELLGVGCAYATIETLFVILSLILYVKLSKEEDIKL